MWYPLAASAVRCSGEEKGEGRVALQLHSRNLKNEGVELNHILSNPLGGKKIILRRASLYRALAIIPLATQFACHILLMSGIPSKSVGFQPPRPQYLAVLWHKTGPLTYSIGVLLSCSCRRGGKSNIVAHAI